LGACCEALWPYDIGKLERKPVERCYSQAKGHLITAYQCLASLQEMKACLAQEIPFMFAFPECHPVMTPAK